MLPFIATRETRIRDHAHHHPEKVLSSAAWAGDLLKDLGILKQVKMVVYRGTIIRGSQV
jgi:hypothetical protein